MWGPFSASSPQGPCHGTRTDNTTTVASDRLAYNISIAYKSKSHAVVRRPGSKGDVKTNPLRHS